MFLGSNSRMLSCYVIVDRILWGWLPKCHLFCFKTLTKLLLIFFSLVITACVLNQSKGHWLLNDTFNSIIFINLKLRTKHENVPSFQTVMEEDFSVTLELICLASSEKRFLLCYIHFFHYWKNMKTKNPITCYPWCWMQGLKIFI